MRQQREVPAHWSPRPLPTEPARLWMLSSSPDLLRRTISENQVSAERCARCCHVQQWTWGANWATKNRIGPEIAFPKHLRRNCGLQNPYLFPALRPGGWFSPTYGCRACMDEPVCPGCRDDLKRIAEREPLLAEQLRKLDRALGAGKRRATRVRKESSKPSTMPRDKSGDPYGTRGPVCPHPVRSPSTPDPTVRRVPALPWLAGRNRLGRTVPPRSSSLSAGPVYRLLRARSRAARNRCACPSASRAGGRSAPRTIPVAPRAARGAIVAPESHPDTGWVNRVPTSEQ